MSIPLRIISFKNTALFKRGIYLSAVSLLAFVAAPAALNGNLWRDPLPSSLALGLLCAALAYFFWKTQIHRLADEVLDCGDSLVARRGRTSESFPFANIATAQVSSSGGFHRITVSLRTRSPWGARIEFLPQASLWSNLPAINRVAQDLTDRARRVSG